MIRRILPVFLLLLTISFATQAQKKTPEQRATAKANIITKYINSKITAGAKVTPTQTAKIKEAYVTFFADKKALRKRKKKFGKDVKAYKADAKKPQNKEGLAKMKERRIGLAKEQKAMNKEQKEMVTRREDAIKATLDGPQKGHFTAMRAEQEAKRKAKKAGK